jgi:hypothetical protein
MAPTSTVSTTSTASPSPASLLWAHQLKREHTYLAERFRQLEAKHQKLDESLQHSEQVQVEQGSKLEKKLGEVINANETALQAHDAARKKDFALVNELRDEIQLLKAVVEAHGRIQTEADVQRQQVIECQVAILKRIAVVEKDATGHADAVTKTSEKVQLVSERETALQIQLDQVRIVARQSKDEAREETQRVARDLDHALRAIQILKERNEKLSENVAKLLAQKESPVGVLPAGQSTIQEQGASDSISPELLREDDALVEQQNLPTMPTKVQEFPASQDDTIDKDCSQSDAVEPAVGKSRPSTKRPAPKASQKASRVVTKRAATRPANQASKRRGNRLLGVDAAASVAQAPSAQPMEGAGVTTSNVILSDMQITANKRDKEALELESNRPSEIEKMNTKKRKGVKPPPSSQMQNKKPKQANNSNIDPELDVKTRGTKRKALDTSTERNSDPLKATTTNEPHPNSRSSDNPGWDPSHAIIAYDNLAQDEDTVTHKTKRPPFNPTLRRSARAQQRQTQRTKSAPQKKAKPTTTAKQPANKPTSVRDPATGKFIKQSAVKRLVRVSSEGSPSLIEDPERAVDPSPLRSHRRAKLSSTTQKPTKQPAKKETRDPRSANLKGRRPLTGFQAGLILSSPKLTKISRTRPTKAMVSKEDSVPESQISSSPPVRQNSEEASTVFEGSVIDGVLANPPPKLLEPPKRPPPVQRPAKRRKITSPDDGDVEELMRLRRELMGI